LVLTEENGKISFTRRTQYKKVSLCGIFKKEIVRIVKNRRFTVKGKNVTILIEEGNDIKVRNNRENIG
jgi:hypothetical protein